MSFRKKIEILSRFLKKSGKILERKAGWLLKRGMDEVDDKEEIKTGMETIKAQRGAPKLIDFRLIGWE